MTTEDKASHDAVPTPSGPGSLLTSGLPHLLDERSDPDFRTVFGLLIRRAASLDTAVARIRITGLDLRPDELRGVERIRVLLAGVNGVALRSEAEAALSDPTKAASLRHLVKLMEEGRIEIRAAPLAGWAPDFSVFHRGGHPWAVLVGPHWFARPYPHRGPALASLHGASASARTVRRFSSLWRSGHDVGGAILELLHGAERRTDRPRVARPSPPPRNRSLPLSRRRRSPARERESPDAGGSSVS